MNSFSVVMYHEIVRRDRVVPPGGMPIDVASRYQDTLPERLFVPEDRFERQMQRLVELGATTLHLSDLVDYFRHGRPLPDRAVVITFDDLYQSLRTVAYPVLKRLNLHAVAFAVTGWLFDRPQPARFERCTCLSWQELAGVLDCFELGNHTDSLHTRGPSGTAAELATDDAFATDIERAESELRALSAGAPSVKAFAYPFGVAPGRLQRAVAETGFQLAFTTAPARNDRNSDPLLLGRFAVFPECDDACFDQIVLGE